MALISGPTIADAIADPANELAKLVADEKDDRKLVNEMFLRILNRPATDKEIDACSASDAVDRRRPSQAGQGLAEREADVAPIRAQQEKEREAAMAAAQKRARPSTKRSLAPKLAEQEKAQGRQDRRSSKPS